jgi:GT2 family glycosyltransferase
VIVLTVLGPTHLADCLSSLRAQTYPADRREVIVVDNASPEDPTPAVRQYYPDAHVIRNPTNVGFAVGNNIGAKAATGEYVVFLNDDTRVHPQWLEELVDTAVRRGAASVGSRMLSWDGTYLDFAGASVNFGGKGFQIDIGQPEAGRHTEERPILFACGGAMLVRRDLFLETGGWDEGTFAYYEDVEAGWRLWLLGHEVWFSPKSIVYHKHHGTSGRWPAPPRLRLYERNSLRIVYTHLERETLERVLPAALLLAADLALLSTELSRESRDADEVAADRRAGKRRRRRVLRDLETSIKAALRERGISRQASVIENLRRAGVRGLLGAALQALKGSTPRVQATSRRSALQIERGAAPFALDGQTEEIPISAAAALCGVNDFLQELPALAHRRQQLQSARRRSDREILSRFGVHWTSPALATHQVAHEEVHRALVEAFGIAEIAKDHAENTKDRAENAESAE